MAMNMMKEAWSGGFDGCEALENTPAVIAKLKKSALDGVPPGPTSGPKSETVRNRRVFRDAMDGDHYRNRRMMRILFREKRFEGFSSW